MPTTSAIGAAGSAAVTGATKNMSQMKPEDFLKLLITQLRSQDPFEPVKNQDLLDQITSIRELQNSMDLSETLSATNLQQQIASAGSLIGKTVQGLNDAGETVAGQVTSLMIKDKKVILQLDTGQQVKLANVTKVAGGPAPTATTTTPTPAVS